LIKISLSLEKSHHTYYEIMSPVHNYNQITLH